MNLLSVKGLAGSMGSLDELNLDENEDEPRVKEKKGLLRRAFSSRRKKKRSKSGHLSPGKRARSPSPQPVPNRRYESSMGSIFT